MANIVMVLRYKDNARRLYCLPDGTSIKIGTHVRVEFPNEFSTCDGVAVSDSYEVDVNTAKMVAVFHRVPGGTLDDLRRVVSIYEEHLVEWPAAEAEETEEAEEA